MCHNQQRNFKKGVHLGYSTDNNPDIEIARHVGIGELRHFSRVHYGGGAACGGLASARVLESRRDAVDRQQQAALQVGRRRLARLSVSRVRVAPLPDAAIAHYIASGEPFGKAGAYAIQGQAAGFIEHIRGSHSGIMGLPLFETAALLRDFGFKV